MSNRQQHRVIDSSCYVLHITPWRETSVIAKVFSREHGIVLVVAKGAKRPFSGLRTILQPFQPLQLSWAGRGEVKTLTQCETRGFHALPAKVLMSCWYMNELILKFLPREDSHPALFVAYAEALTRLATGLPQASTLRGFEWSLLSETGYGIDAPRPDFDDGTQAETWRQRLRLRLDAQLYDADLQSRRVMMSLRQTTESV